MGKLLNYFSSVCFQCSNLSLFWSACPRQYAFHLVDGRSAWKNRFSLENLSYQASQAPDIDGLRVICRTDQNLRSPVPTSGNVLSENVIFFLLLIQGAHKSKITQFGVTVFINQDVGRFQVSVDEPAGVNVEHGFTDLVENPLFMFFLQNTFSDQSKQINVHVLKDQINIDIVIGANDLF